MNHFRLLAILVIVTVVAVVAVLRSNRAPDTEVTADATVEQPLVVDLNQDIDDVSGLQIIAADNQMVADLKRTEQAWVVANRANYPADMGKVRETLITLANAQLMEKKTAKPEYYERLGVQDISQQQATGVQLSIQGLDNPVELIVGNPAAGRNGVFVRRVGDTQSWLASGNLALPQDTVQWLDRSILDIPAQQIQGVTIRHADGETINAEKQTKDQTHFTVTNLPEGRELTAENAANTLADALTALQLEDVSTREDNDPAAADGVVEITYKTFDGTIIGGKAFQIDDKSYVYFTVDFDEALAQRFVGETEESSQDETTLAERRQAAQQLDEKLEPWVYEIASFHYDPMTQRMADLLKKEEVIPQPTQTETGETTTQPQSESPVKNDTQTEPAAEPQTNMEGEAQLETQPAAAPPSVRPAMPEAPTKPQKKETLPPTELDSTPERLPESAVDPDSTSTTTTDR